MRHITFIPRTRTLLAGAMAALAGGQALAETAGRVSFVNGSVSATSPDGQSRALRRGDAINGGDRIETRSGRLQIRFTDGGFVSLQPNTVFGVDQYLYANKAPEETSLFFSLLRGGMRTVTGAIGKVNKQSYKVRTPVATIGIRGTGYLAETDSERTLVSVGAGLVYVENSFGNATGAAGQNIEATLQRPPQLTREAPEIRATRPEGDAEEALADNSEDDTPAFGEQVDADGNTLLLVKDSSGNFVFITPVIAATLQNSNPVTQSPVFSLAAPIYNGSVANFIHNKLLATFDQSTGINRGAMLTLDSANGPVFDSGTLKFSGVTTLKNLSWGEFTDGAAAIDNLGSGLVASATQFEPYIVGYSATSLLGSGKATYNLVGGSTPRLNQTIAATLNNFTITIDFDFALLDLALGVTANGVTANVTGNDIAVPDIFVNGTFNLSTSNSNQLTVSGSACTSFCTADISGFFAGVGGTQIGSAYSILTDVGTIKGVAALDSGTPSSSAGVLPDAKLYTMTTTANAAVLGGYNYGDPLSMSLLADFNTNGELVSATELYPSTNTRLQNQTASVADAGTRKTLSWGRFVNGDVLIDGSPVTLAGPDSVHYVIGQETPAAMMSALAGQGGTATYSLNGHTTPTGINGVGSSVSGNLIVNFGAATIGVNMDVDMGANLYGVTGSMAIAGAQFAGTGLSTTINGGSCPSGCSTDINGFFSGQQAQQIGLTYKISDFGTDTIKGAATFERGNITLPLP